LSFIFDLVLNLPYEKKLDHLECLQLYIGGGAIFIFLFQDYFVKRQRKIIWFIVIFSLLSAAIIARRTIVVTYIATIILYFIANCLDNKNLVKKIVYILCIVIATAIISVILIRYAEQLFPRLVNRLDDDTRTGVELEVLYILEKGNLMSGLGMNSFYYSTYINEFRDGCETGYLNMLMKGGIIYLVLFYLLCIPAIFKLMLKIKKGKEYIRYLFYVLIVLVIGNAASSTFTFSIRYITFLIIILSMYKRNKYKTHEI
jgi:hypothetical protein